MPNPVYQCTLTLKNIKGQETNEDYFTQGFSSHQTAMTEFNNLVSKRSQLLGVGVAITKKRVSDTAIKRDAYCVYVTNNNGANKSPELGATQYSDVLFNRFYERMYAGGFHQWGMKFFSGVPDEVCQKMGDMDLAQASVPWWTGALGVFNDYLAPKVGVSAWGLYGVESPVPALPILDILTVVVNADRTVTFTTSLAHGFAVNDRVQLFGGILTPWLNNGFKKVIAVPDATTFTVRRALVPGPAAIDQPGQARRANLVLTPWTTIEPVRFTPRRGVGRPSDSPRGRRRARSSM